MYSYYLASNKFLLKILIVIFYFHYFANSDFAQISNITKDPDGNTPFTVEFISQFSTTKDFKKSEGLSNRIFNFLFGSAEKRLIKPISMTIIANNSWIIIDQGNNSVMYLQSDKGDFYNLSKTTFPSPTGICAGSENQIYFTDSYLNKIFMGNISDKKFKILNDSMTLKRPTGIAFVQERKEIWVVETMAHHITVMNLNGMVLRTYGSRGTSPGEFNFPTFIWIDTNGLVYIVDSMNFRIQIMNLDGEIIFYFGETGDATGYFARPKGIATDSYGHIYVVDALFHTVQIFDRDGQFLSNFGQQGREPGQFWLPVGIYIDAYDRIYVADSYNARIQVFQLIPGSTNEN